MSGLPGTTAVAERFPLSALWMGEGMAGSRGIGVRRVWSPDFGDCRDDFPGHADAVTGVVSRYVVGDHPEEWRQRVGVAASAGPEEL